MEGIFVERWVAVKGGGERRGRGLASNHDYILFASDTGKKRVLCALSLLRFLPSHLYRLISLSFLLLRVSVKSRKRLCDLSLPFSCITLSAFSQAHKYKHIRQIFFLWNLISLGLS